MNSCTIGGTLVLKHIPSINRVNNITSYPYWGHWGFTGGSTKGQLGGFEQSTLVELEDSSYSVAPFGPFANGGNGVPYNELELYLMGMAPLSSVITI